jgi:hypothetical protein
MTEDDPISKRGAVVMTVLTVALWGIAAGMILWLLWTFFV